jgi:hypothetical protein
MPEGGAILPWQSRGKALRGASTIQKGAIGQVRLCTLPTHPISILGRSFGIPEGREIQLAVLLLFLGSANGPVADARGQHSGSRVIAEAGGRRREPGCHAK